jgi:hypothetical protein
MSIFKIFNRGDRQDFSSKNRLEKSGAVFFNEYRQSAKELSARYNKIEKAGVRLLPSPFSSIVSFVSDIDGSDRKKTDFYHNYLIYNLGLDFGNSIRLFNTPYNFRAVGQALCPFDCFFPPFYSKDRSVEQYYTGFEILREYYLGNYDHLHGISGLGGSKMVRIPVNDHMDSSTIQQPMPGNFDENSRLRSADLAVMGLAIQVEDGKVPDGTQVSVNFNMTSSSAHNCPAKGLNNENIKELRLRRIRIRHPTWNPQFSINKVPPALYEIDESNRIIPILKHIHNVRIVFAEGTVRPRVLSVNLLSCHREVMLRLLKLVSQEYDFIMNLYTEHGGFTYLNDYSEEYHSSIVARHIYQEKLPSLHVGVKNAEVYFSALGDDPESFMYLLPEMKKDMGIRFINPGGSTGKIGDRVRLTEAVLPVKTREESLIYMARRMMPEMPKVNGREHPLARDGTMRTISARLEHMFTYIADEPNTVWPIYTHLGNLRKAKEDGNITPPIETFFHDSVFHRLQDSVFNISSNIPPNKRIWFTRASMLYDYDLMIQNIAEHLERLEDNTIVIHSWHDPVLEIELPVSAGQLNGLTFYTEDANSAILYLDNSEIHELVRNGPDETGRESVTIFGAGPCHVILDEVDLLSSGSQAARLDGELDYQWIRDQGSFRGRHHARLTLRKNGCFKMTLAA